MNTSKVLGVVGFFGLSLLVGCAGAQGEDTAAANGAATSANKIQSGVYDSQLSVIVKGTQVEGSFASQVGDPAHGGATCSFTFAGFIETVGGADHAQITVTDGSDIVGGELVAQADGSLRARLVNPVNACMRTSPELTDGGSNFGARKALASDVTGFRSVKVDKSFFYDRAGGAPRAAYVVLMNTVVLTGAEQSGFLPARYNTTKGFLKTSELMGTFAPVPHDTLRAKYRIEQNDSSDASFEVITSQNRDLFFNLGIVNKFGGNNMGDIQQGHASIVGDTATYAGVGCKIVFAFAPDAKTVTVTQDAFCGDFGSNVDVSGTYDRQ